MGVATLPADCEAAKSLFEFGALCNTSDAPALHPSTAPDAIAAAQLAAVRRAVAAAPRGGLPLSEWVSDLSDATDLPLWSVRRKLAELGLIDGSEAAVKVSNKDRVGDERFRKVADCLRRLRRWAAVHEIVAATGLTPAQVRSVVAWPENGFKFRRVRAPRDPSNVQRVYQLAAFKRGESK